MNTATFQSLITRERNFTFLAQKLHQYINNVEKHPKTNSTHGFSFDLGHFVKIYAKEPACYHAEYRGLNISYHSPLTKQTVKSVSETLSLFDVKM